MSISKSAMLVHVTFSKWGGRKLDKRISGEVQDREAADRDLGNFNKRLLSNEALKGINNAFQRVKDHLETNTLPWNRRGDCLLPNARYLSFIEKHTELVADAEAEVEKFIDTTYLSEMERARFHMGTAFNPDDYPTPQDLRHKFRISTEILPVPDAGDFRVDMDRAEKTRIQQDIEERVSRQIGSVVTTLWERLYDQLVHLRDAWGPEAKRRHAKRLTDIQELAEILPDLNITNDPDLDRIGQRVRDLLAGVDPEVRNLDDDRKALLSEVDDITSEMAGLMNVFGNAA